MGKLLQRLGRFVIWMIKVIVLVTGSWSLAIVAAGFAVRAVSDMDVFSVREFIGVFSVWNITDSTFPATVLAIMWGTVFFMFISGILFLRFAHAIDLERACSRVLRSLWPVRTRQERSEPELEVDDSETEASGEATAGAAPEEVDAEPEVALPRGKPRSGSRRRMAELDEGQPAGGEAVDEQEPAEQADDEVVEDQVDDRDDWRAPPPITVFKRNMKAMVMMAFRYPMRFIKSIVNGVFYKEAMDHTAAKLRADHTGMRPDRLKKAMAVRHRDEQVEPIAEPGETVQVDEGGEQEVLVTVEKIKALFAQYQLGRDHRSDGLLRAMVEVAAARDEVVYEALVDDVGSARAGEMIQVLDAVVDAQKKGSPARRAQVDKQAADDETAAAERAALGGAGVGGAGDADEGEAADEEQPQRRPGRAAARRVRGLDDHGGEEVQASAPRSSRRVLGDDGWDEDLSGAPEPVPKTQPKSNVSKPATAIKPPAAEVARAGSSAVSAPAGMPAPAALSEPAGGPPDAVPEDVEPALADLSEVRELQQIIASAGLTSDLLNQLGNEVGDLLRMDERVADFLIYGERGKGPLPLVTRWSLGQLAEMLQAKQKAMVEAVAKSATNAPAGAASAPAVSGAAAPATTPAGVSAVAGAPIEAAAIEAAASPAASGDADDMDAQLADLPAPPVSAAPARRSAGTVGSPAASVERGPAVSPMENAPTAPATAADIAREEAGTASAAADQGERPTAKRVALDGSPVDPGQAAPKALIEISQVADKPEAETAGKKEFEAMSSGNEGQESGKATSNALAGGAGSPVLTAAARQPASAPAAASAPASRSDLVVRPVAARGVVSSLDEIFADSQSRRLGFVTGWLQKMAEHIERSETDRTYNPMITGPILVSSRESKVKIVREVSDNAPDVFNEWYRQIEQLMPEYLTMVESLMCEAEEQRKKLAGGAHRPTPAPAIPPAGATRVEAPAAATAMAVPAVAEPAGEMVRAEAASAAASAEAAAKAEPLAAPTETRPVEAAAAAAAPQAPAETGLAEIEVEKPAAAKVEQVELATASAEFVPASAGSTSVSAAPAGPAPAASAPTSTGPTSAGHAGGAVDMQTLMSFMAQTLSQTVSQTVSQTLEQVQRTNMAAMQTLAREIREVSKSHLEHTARVAERSAPIAAALPAPTALIAPAIEGVSSSAGDTAEGAVEHVDEEAPVTAVGDQVVDPLPVPANESVPVKAVPAAGADTSAQLEEAPAGNTKARNARKLEIERKLEIVLTEHRFKVRTKLFLFSREPAKAVVAVDVMASRLAGDCKAMMFVIVDEPETHWVSAEVGMEVGGNGLIVEPVAVLRGESVKGGSHKFATPLMLRPLAVERYRQERGVDVSAAPERLMICVLIVNRSGERVLPDADFGQEPARNFEILSTSMETLATDVEALVRKLDGGHEVAA